jgi:hypothetical protein
MLAEAWIGKGLLIALHFQDREQALECFGKARELGDARAEECIKMLTASRDRPTAGYTLHLPDLTRGNDSGTDSDRTTQPQMDEESGLALALVHLLQGRLARDFAKREAMAEKAIEIASRWPDSWVSKGIRWNANSFLLYDLDAALAVFGGSEQAWQVIESSCIEKFFTKGISSLCGQKYETALEAFRAAGQIEQNNPFINVCIAIVLIEQGAADASSAIQHCRTLHQGHPLLSLIQFNTTA